MKGDRDVSPLVTAEWLTAHLSDPNVRVVDVRWRSRYENGRGISFDDYDGYLAGHIPGAVFAGMVADLSDPHHPVPDMLVGPEQFARVMGRLGIGDNTLVVAYDNMGFPVGSARLWWALSYYGHDQVRVLDGGLRAWQAEGRPLSTDLAAPAPATFTPRVRPEWKASKEDVVAAIGKPGTVIVDCLNPELYRGGGAPPVGSTSRAHPRRGKRSLHGQHRSRISHRDRSGARAHTRERPVVRVRLTGDIGTRLSECWGDARPRSHHLLWSRICRSLRVAGAQAPGL
jgi:3-mercaptopyruvate sulfurtransferase SseA